MQELSNNLMLKRQRSKQALSLKKQKCWTSPILSFISLKSCHPVLKEIQRMMRLEKSSLSILPMLSIVQSRLYWKAIEMP